MPFVIENQTDFIAHSACHITFSSRCITDFLMKIYVNRNICIDSV